MVTVLVVDDSPADRALVGRLLAEEFEVVVRYAQNGPEAIGQLETGGIDLLVTDLMMPGLTGLELVAAVRERLPLVPTILMTSQGTEDIAWSALQAGAASYIPKPALADRLSETIRRVLDAAARRRERRELLGRMSWHRCLFVLHNDPRLIGPLVGCLQSALRYMGELELPECTRVGVALEEALCNALYHGNLELSSDLRNRGEAAFRIAAEERRAQTPFCHRHIGVEVELTRAEARFTISDEGPGFDPSELPDPTDPENLIRLSGRGVLLMRTFMDEVRYNDTGNKVTMVKKLQLASQSRVQDGATGR